MSTRSLIAQQHDDGTICVIYCHFDGYPEHHAPILIEHYIDPALVTALIDLGDLSVLAEQIGEQHDFEWRREYYRTNTDPDTDPRDKWCLAYGRDRGEAGTKARVFANEEAWRATWKDSWAEYFYLYRDGAWLIWNRHGGRWDVLTTAVITTETE